MPRTSSLERAKEEILSHLSASKNKVFNQTDLTAILRENRDKWELAQRITFGDFAKFLMAEGRLRAVDLPSEGASYPPFRRYVWGEVSAFEIAVALKKHAYLSHSTAVYLHGLTEHIPLTVYVNAEQTAKPRPHGSLSQESLDRAFRGSQRSSRYVFVYERNRIVILSGKQTGRYGVIDGLLPNGASAPVTDLERTLVDVCVRPAYGGGVHQVLESFNSAVGRISLTRLLETLEALDYAYPYHQAIGFYLKRAGVADKDLEPFRKLGANYDFYLAHGMKEPILDSAWRVYYPKRL